MTLLGIVLTFTMLMSERIFLEAPRLHLLKAQAAADKQLALLKENAAYLDFVTEIDGLEVEGKFTRKGQAKGIIELSLEVRDPNSQTLLLSEKHLLTNEEE